MTKTTATNSQRNGVFYAHVRLAREVVASLDADAERRFEGRLVEAREYFARVCRLKLTRQQVPAKC